MNEVKPINDFWRWHWKAVEKMMIAEVENAPRGSIRQRVANVFYMRARHHNTRIAEYDFALTMKHWPFYRMMAQSIANDFP